LFYLHFIVSCCAKNKPISSFCFLPSFIGVGVRTAQHSTAQHSQFLAEQTTASFSHLFIGAKIVSVVAASLLVSAAVFSVIAAAQSAQAIGTSAIAAAISAVGFLPSASAKIMWAVAAAASAIAETNLFHFLTIKQ